jgi:hypothetical protein
MGPEDVPEGSGRVQRPQLDALEAPLCEPQQEELGNVGIKKQNNDVYVDLASLPSTFDDT